MAKVVETYKESFADMVRSVDVEVAVRADLVQLATVRPKKQDGWRATLDKERCDRLIDMLTKARDRAYG